MFRKWYETPFCTHPGDQIGKHADEVYLKLPKKPHMEHIVNLLPKGNLKSSSGSPNPNLYSNQEVQDLLVGI